MFVVRENSCSRRVTTHLDLIGVRLLILAEFPIVRQGSRKGILVRNNNVKLVRWLLWVAYVALQ